MSKITRVIGGLEHEFYFSIQLGIVTPTDELHHFSEGLGIPPTSRVIKQVSYNVGPPRYKLVYKHQ